MKIYLAGPMSGIAEFNKPEFDKAAKVLRDAGHDVVSPAEFDTPEDLEGLNIGDGLGVTHLRRAEFLRRDFALLLECDAVALLRNWPISIGANCEVAVANMAGIPVYPLFGLDGVLSLDQNSEPVVPMWARVMSHAELTAAARWTNPQLPLEAG